jgi:hypothetical protein
MRYHVTKKGEISDTDRQQERALIENLDVVTFTVGILKPIKFVVDVKSSGLEHRRTTLPKKVIGGGWFLKDTRAISFYTVDDTQMVSVPMTGWDTAYTKMVLETDLADAFKDDKGDPRDHKQFQSIFGRYLRTNKWYTGVTDPDLIKVLRLGPPHELVGADSMAMFRIWTTHTTRRISFKQKFEFDNEADESSTDASELIEGTAHIKIVEMAISAIGMILKDMKRSRCRDDSTGTEAERIEFDKSLFTRGVDFVGNHSGALKMVGAMAALGVGPIITPIFSEVVANNFMGTDDGTDGTLAAGVRYGTGAAASTVSRAVVLGSAASMVNDSVHISMSPPTDTPPPPAKNWGAGTRLVKKPWTAAWGSADDYKSIGCNKFVPPAGYINAHWNGSTAAQYEAYSDWKGQLEAYAKEFKDAHRPIKVKLESTTDRDDIDIGLKLAMNTMRNANNQIQIRDTASLTVYKTALAALTKTYNDNLIGKVGTKVLGLFSVTAKDVMNSPRLTDKGDRATQPILGKMTREFRGEWTKLKSRRVLELAGYTKERNAALNLVYDEYTRFGLERPDLNAIVKKEDKELDRATGKIRKKSASHTYDVHRAKWYGERRTASVRRALEHGKQPTPIPRYKPRDYPYKVKFDSVSDSEKDAIIKHIEQRVKEVHEKTLLDQHLADMKLWKIPLKDQRGPEMEVDPVPKPEPVPKYSNPKQVRNNRTVRSSRKAKPTAEVDISTVKTGKAPRRPMK